jgi:hypothetical protein
MSTLKAVNIQHPSSSIPAITLDSTGAMTGSFPYPNRNLLYNGAMQVHQRSSSVASITSSSYNTADRWQLLINSLGTWTQSVETDAPTGSGFRKSLRMLCTTAKASPSAGDFCYIGQKLEGQDLQRIKKGTGSAEGLALSFWVKSNVTGTYVVELEDTDNSRTISATYSILQSSTWEKKTISFSADIVGALNNDAEMSLVLGFWLAAGSNFTSGTLQTAWGATTAAKRSVGQTNLASATNNFWQITGVQLETGPVATPFEFKSFGQELRECQRYFQKIAQITATSNTATTVSAWASLSTEMRVAPVGTATGPLNFQGDGSMNVTQSSASVGTQYHSPFSLYFASIGNFSGLTASRTGSLGVPVNNSNHIALSAEL